MHLRGGWHHLPIFSKGRISVNIERRNLAFGQILLFLTTLWDSSIKTRFCEQRNWPIAKKKKKKKKPCPQGIPQCSVRKTDYTVCRSIVEILPLSGDETRLRWNGVIWLVDYVIAFESRVLVGSLSGRIDDKISAIQEVTLACRRFDPMKTRLRLTTRAQWHSRPFWTVLKPR